MYGVHICILYNSFTHFQPPVCDANGENTLRRRRKRQTIEIDDSDGELYDPDREDLRVKVYSGLYVNEAEDLDDDEIVDDLVDVVRPCLLTSIAGFLHFPLFQRAYDPNTFCISQRSFAIGIAIAGLILMTAVVVAIMILVSKRRRKNLSTTGSSIYSGPYTNTAYSHSSMSRRS